MGKEPVARATESFRVWGVTVCFARLSVNCANICAGPAERVRLR